MDVLQAELHQLRKLEESLWISETRFDRDYMEKILHSDFIEFGRSGRVYARQEVVDCPRQDIKANLPLKSFKVYKLTQEVFQTTYVSEVMYEDLEIGNRNSIWIKTPDGWKLRFHQGTPVK